MLMSISEGEKFVCACVHASVNVLAVGAAWRCCSSPSTSAWVPWIETQFTRLVWQMIYLMSHLATPVLFC